MSGILIETERLVLRNWREADRDPFAEMSLDPEVMAHLDGPMDRAASDALIDRLLGEAQQNGATFWAVERKGDGAFLGFCGLRRGGHPGTAVPAELEIGWRLRRDAWGQGFAREAAAASLSWEIPLCLDGHFEGQSPTMAAGLVCRGLEVSISQEHAGE